MYDLIQNTLTATAEFIALAGLTGIIIHAFYTQHKRFMDAYCPPIATHTPDSQTDETKVDKPLLTPEIPSQPEFPVVVDPWQMEITTSSPRYWVHTPPLPQPTLYLLPPAKEELKPAKKTRKTTASPKAPTKSHTRKRKAA